MNKKQIVLLSVLSSISSTHLLALPPCGFVRPFEYNFVIPQYGHNHAAVDVQLHGGVAVNAYNLNGTKVSPLHYLQPNENSLAMVKGFAAGTEQSAIAQQFNVNDDDGTRGRLVFNGKISAPVSALFTLHKVFHEHWFVGLSLPVYSMKLSNLSWADQTLNLNLADTLTKTLLTNNLAANVARLGNNLTLQDWSKTGPGDVACIGGYRHNFFQNKPWIKEVMVNVRAGFTLPTGLTQDEDLLMNMPFGNDGSVALIVGGGLELNLKQRVRAGLDVNFLHTFNNTRARRIKVDSTQTDFLLLTKTDVQKDPGFFQEFNIYLEPKIIEGLSFLWGYQYKKKGKDHFYVVSNAYSSTIANTAESLKEWTMHSMLLQSKVALDTLTGNERAPHCSLFCTVPFNGLRSLQVVDLGCSIFVDF